MEAFRLIIRAQRLSRHWKIQFSKWRSLVGEHAVATVKLIFWVPRLWVSYRSGDFKSRSRHCQPTVQNGLDAIPTHYINLDRRLDRKTETLREFDQLALPTPTRFKAVDHVNGELGCALSHLKLMNHLVEQSSDLTMICEDDIAFQSPKSELTAILEEFQRLKNVGVLCLAYRARGPKIPISRTLAISNNIQMAACYVVKPFAMQPLARSFRRSASHLGQGDPGARFAIDQLWKEVQTREIHFCIPKKPLVSQRESFSDIAMKRKLYR